MVPAPLVLCECARVCRVRAVWCRCSARVRRVRSRVRPGVAGRAVRMAMMGLGVQVSMPARSAARAVNTVVWIVVSNAKCP